MRISFFIFRIMFVKFYFFLIVWKGYDGGGTEWNGGARKMSYREDTLLLWFIICQFFVGKYVGVVECALLYSVVIDICKGRKTKKRMIVKNCENTKGG